MVRKIVCILVFTVLLLSTSALGSSRTVRFFSQAEGLPGNRIFCLFQDRDGQIWAGTNQGAGVYDGRQWRSYTVDEGLPGSSVYSIIQDTAGNFWFGTSGGICRFNGQGWDRLGRLEGMTQEDRITALRDRDGNLWFGGGGGLYLLDADNQNISRVEKMTLKNITSLFLDRNGQLWITSSEGIACYDGRRWKEYVEKDGLPSTPIKAGYQDVEDTFWFATDKGLVEYNSFSFSTMNTDTHDLPSNHVETIGQDKRGRLWVGTSEGPAFYDGYSWRQPSGLDQWPDKKIGALLVDQSGNLWLGTEAGVIFLDLSWDLLIDETFGMTPHHPFLISSRGDFWYSVEEGAESLSGRIIERWGPKDGLEGTVRTMYEDHEGTLWFGTDQGLYGYDGRGFVPYQAPAWKSIIVEVSEYRWVREQYREYDIYQGLTDNLVNCISQDERGFLWVGTDMGLSALSDGRWQLFEDVPLLNGPVLTLAGGKLLWAGTTQGLLVYNGTEWKDVSSQGGPTNVTVTSLLLEGEDHLWAGTDKGLWELRDGSWTNYRQKDGLLSDRVSSLARDATGHLWIGTNSGLSIFDHQRWSSISQKDGLPSQEVLSIIPDKTGFLWVAGNNYLSAYHPDAIPPETRIKNPPVQPISSTQHLFELYGSDLLTEPLEILYSYRLDNGNWSEFTREALATISGLNNGTHVFEVRAIDRGLNIDPTPAVVMFEVNTALFDIEVRDLAMKDLYASLYHYYTSDFTENSPVGQMTLHNKFDQPLKVKVSLIIPNFMDFSTDRIVTIGPGKDYVLPLRIELNESILHQRDNTVGQMLVTLQYHLQGEIKESTFSLGVPINGRNAMNWNDPEIICIFISHLDREIETLSGDTVALGKPLEEKFVLDNNFIRAVSLFTFLKKVGVRYLPDPEHPYTGFSSEKKTLDYIRFPRETLARKSGDCDDISILYSAFLQSVGIDTALVDVFDHVFVMFDSGLRGNEHRLITPDRSQVYFDDQDRVWIPVETTLVGQSFMKAWEKGAEEMSAEPKNIIIVKDAWKKYQPVIGGTEVPLPKFDLPGSDFLEEVSSDLAYAEDILLGTSFSRLRNQAANEPDNFKIWNRMGIILGKKGYFQKAERFFNHVIRLKPDFPGGYSNMGNICYERGAYTKAVDFYNKSLEREPGNSQVHVELALTYAEMGDFDRARKHYLEAVKINPGLKVSKGH